MRRSSIQGGNITQGDGKFKLPYFFTNSIAIIHYTLPTKHTIYLLLQISLFARDLLILLMIVRSAFFSRAMRDQNESAIDDSDDKKPKVSGSSVSTTGSDQKANDEASTRSQEQKNKNDLKVLGGGHE